MPKGLKVDLLVVRENHAESKPCEQCIRYMKSLSVNIRKVTYSSDGYLVTEPLDDLENDHKTIYYRSMEYFQNMRENQICPKVTDKAWIPKVKCRCPTTYKYKCKHTKKMLTKYGMQSQ